MALPRLRQLLRPTVAQQSPAPWELSSGPPVEADDSWGGFPPARYFAILGELPENYRGTATVALHRSCMIAAQTGRPLEILTLGHTVDYEALTREMRSDGRLTELVRFRNMWTDLATMHPERARPSKGAFVSARNDVMVNLAIIAMALLTLVTDSAWPDIVLGLGIILIALHSAWEVWEASEEERLASKALAGEDLCA